MELNQNSNDNFEEIVDRNGNRNRKSILIENLNYMYPNGHSMNNQVKWFKGSRDRGLRADMAS